MAIPKPQPDDWLKANIQELRLTDREVLEMLRDAKKRVEQILKELPKDKQQIRRAQLENSRAKLLAAQAEVYDRLGDIVEARRARAAGRAARLSAAADKALLDLVGRDEQGQFLYERALDVSQRAIDTSLARMKMSQLPLSQRIYRSRLWMDGRLGKLINATMAAGLNAREFAKAARDWFNPNTPGGIRYAAMRLARTEINNAFHAMSAQKYATTPWINQVEWNLSGSHPTPDECDVLAARSPFPSDAVPARPHPQCLCYITPVSVDEDEFVDNFLNGDYDDYLDGELERNGWVGPEPEKQQQPAPAKPTAVPFDQRVDNAAKKADALNAASYGVERKLGAKNYHRMPLDAKASVTHYTSKAYREINRQNRGRPEPGANQAEVRRHIDNIDEAMRGSTLNQEVLVYRGMRDASRMFGDRINSDMTGLEWKEESYVSTTAFEGKTKNFISGSSLPNRILMRILVPAGSHAVEASGTSKEAELLIDRNTQYRVVADNGVGEDGIRRLDVEVF